MAFAQPIPRPFNEHSIRLYAPASSGVFGISSPKQWISVGEAPDIQAALLQQWREQDASFRACAPTGFVFEQCVLEVRQTRRTQLAAEYRPVYQQHAASGARA